MFFPTKHNCGHINWNFHNCREPFSESPKTFRPKIRNDKRTCSFYWRKISTRKPSRYVEFGFNIFLNKFRTLFTKTFVQKLQQNFSLDKLTHIQKELSHFFWKNSTFFLLQSQNKITKDWVPKTRVNSFQKNTLDTQDAFFKNPPQNFQKLWNWLTTIWQNLHSQSFPTDFECCFDKPAENIPSKVQKPSNRSPEKLHPFQKSSVFLKTFLWSRRCSSLKAGKKTLTKSATFLIRVQKKRWKTFFEKIFYSKCSFGHVECIFDSSAVKN